MMMMMMMIIIIIIIEMFGMGGNGKPERFYATKL